MLDYALIGYELYIPLLPAVLELPLLLPAIVLKHLPKQFPFPFPLTLLVPLLLLPLLLPLAPPTQKRPDGPERYSSAINYYTDQYGAC